MWATKVNILKRIKENYETLFYTYFSIHNVNRIHKERLQKKFCGKYQNLSEEEKNKGVSQYGCEHYKILPEEEKQRLVDYIKNIIECKKLIKTS